MRERLPLASLPGGRPSTRRTSSAPTQSTTHHPNTSRPLTCGDDPVAPDIAPLSELARSCRSCIRSKSNRRPERGEASAACNPRVFAIPGCFRHVMGWAGVWSGSLLRFPPGRRFKGEKVAVRPGDRVRPGRFVGGSGLRVPLLERVAFCPQRDFGAVAVFPAVPGQT